MNKLKLFVLLSLRYWRHNLSKLMLIMLSSIIGAATISAAALLIRSEKSSILNKNLNTLGNYDVTYFCMDKSSFASLAEMKQVEDIGYYSELGYATCQGNNTRNKVISFPDRNSQNLYHQECVKGHYPVRDDEISVDISIIKNSGYKYDIGSTVELILTDINDQPVGNRSYVISGIYEASNNNSVGGWNRYPVDAGENEYVMPAIVMNPSQNDQFKSDIITVFIQVTTNRYLFWEEFGNLCKTKGISYQYEEWGSGRSWAYSVILGIRDTIDSIYDEMNYENVVRAIHDGNIIKDFYSAVLIPIYCITIGIVVFILMKGIVSIVLEDRTEFYGDIIITGLSKKTCLIYIVAEIVSLSSIATGIGLILGSLIHIVQINTINDINGKVLGSGFSVDPFVKSVTYSPWVLSFVVILGASLISLIPSLAKIRKLTPIELVNHNDSLNHSGKRKIDSETKITTWKKLLNRKIELHSNSVMICFILVLSSAFFGRVYFNVLSYYETQEYRAELANNNLSNCDYSITLSRNLLPTSFGILNHHDYGVTPEAAKEIESMDFVGKITKEVFNVSTRFSYVNGEISQELSNLLTGVNLRYQYDEDKDGIFAPYYDEGNHALAREIGYSDNEQIYGVPTLGLTESDIQRLCVVSGTIKLDKINSGEEIIIAVERDNEDIAIESFPVGSSIPLSDIVLSDEEEKMDFNNITESNVKHVYDALVKMDDGSNVNVFAAAFGKRYDIRTRVGAIVALDHDDLDLLHGYPVIIICNGEKTFESWGLPDKNYTSYKISLKEGTDLEKANIAIISELSKCDGCYIESAYDMQKRINDRTIEVMSVFYLISFLLSIVGMFAVAVGLYTVIRVRRDDIDILRTIGMNNNQVIKMIIRQNLFYPFIGTLFGLFPLLMCQLLFNYVYRKVSTGQWEYGLYESGATIPWYSNIPFQYNLFEFGVFDSLVMCVLVGFCLILIGTIPQIVYIKKHKLING